MFMSAAQSNTMVATCASLSEQEIRRLRGTELRMVFQNPMTSLNPVWPIGDQVTEGLRLYGGLGTGCLAEKSIECSDASAFQAPNGAWMNILTSGRGACCSERPSPWPWPASPKLLFADEPTTALDVTIQDQILAFLLELQERTA